MDIDPKELARWCAVPADRLLTHPDRKVPLALVADSAAMGEAMATFLADEIAAGNKASRPTRAIIPCGPTAWYAPWRRLVNERKLDLRQVHVFHMDECLDWEARPLPRNHPYNFRTFMEREFYGGIPDALNVPQAQRHWLLPSTVEAVRDELARQPADLTLGGWGQDGHVAYNQAKRHPLHHVSLEQLAASTVRVQENNLDTFIALGQRTFGSAFQFVPPMSVTIGVRECLAAKKIRVYSDTGAWKQTALRVALFGPPTAEYPMTLLQRHPDALLTATLETARHPIAEHPEWELF